MLLGDLNVDSADVASDTLLKIRRITWIRALEDGSYDQGSGQLFRQDGHWEGEFDYEGDFLPDPDTATFCCLGVARDVPTVGEWSAVITRVDSDDQRDYEWVSDYYGISDHLKRYLMSMNDGEKLSNEQGTEDEWKWIRHSTASRDFKFIARFLRKVWGLSDESGATDA